MSLFVIGSTATAVLAAIAAPDTLTINSIDAYQSVIETNDQLHIVSFEISYTSNPADDAGTNFLFRFYDSGVEIATATPYAYFDSGYDQGVIAFYFPATFTSLPTWTATTLSIELVGNPALDWGGDPPTTTSITWDSWNTSTALVGARVRTLAQALENAWGGTTDLIERVQSVNVLTSTGEDYFETVIPNLRTISPEIFASATVTPDIPTDNHTMTYAETVEARWTTSGNGTFDMSTVAGLFNTSRNWASSMLYVAFCFGVLFAASYRITAIRSGAGTMAGVGLRPALFLFGALLIVGSFMGFMVFEVGLFCGIAGGLAVVFALFWRGSV